MATNIHNDPRVSRGNTYNSHHAVLPASGQQPVGFPTKATRRRKRPQGKTIYNLQPPARKHIPVNLAPHLLEQVGDVSYSTIDTQTGVHQRRKGGCFGARPDLEDPAYDSFVPVKSGVDASTQIEVNDHLFNFDAEVEPLLDIIVGKTLEWARLEVEEEEELASLQRRRDELVEGKRLESDRVRSLQEAEMVKWAQKEWAMKRESLRVHHERIAEEKIAAMNFYGAAFGDLETNVFHSLTDSGHFRNRQRDAVEFRFMPWILGEMAKVLGRAEGARGLVDDLIHAALTSTRHGQ